MTLKKPYLLVFWFLPILISNSTVRFQLYGIEEYIPVVQFLLCLAGLLFLLVKIQFVCVSSLTLLMVSLIALNMLFSDITEFNFIGFILIYAILVHALAKLYPNDLWSHYYSICLIIGILTIIDLTFFLFSGGFLISYRTPEVIGIGLPRINTIFDEMSHQAFFMMPSVIFSIFQKTKGRILLTVGLLLTMSAAALVLFFLVFLIYARDKLFKNFLQFSSIVLIMLIALLVGGDFIFNKLENIFLYERLVTGELTKSISAANILLGYEIMKYISIADLMVGYGYFGLSKEIPLLLVSSDLYNYFQMIGALDDPKSVGLFNLVLYFGLIQCCLFGFWYICQNPMPMILGCIS